MQPPSLKSRALRWLAQREHSRAEIERKLRDRVAPDDPAAAGIDALLDELESKGLLSDARAAESLLAGKGQRLGSLRLKQELQQRGIGAELLADTVAAARAGDAQRARQLWQRRFGTPAADAAERARQARYLAARGFPADIVARVVRNLDDEA